jgi:predicted RNA methylase
MINYCEADHLDRETQQQLGSFYTPKELAEKMARLLDWKPGQKIIDVCCGKGNLFVACLNIYPQLTNDLIYGIDIDKKAIEFCIKKFPGGHFRVGDCLEDDIRSDHFWKEREYSTQSYQDFCKKNKPPFKFGL